MSCIVDSPSSSFNLAAQSPTLVDNRPNSQAFASQDLEAVPPIPLHVTPNGFSSSSSIHFSPPSAGSNTVEKVQAARGSFHQIEMWYEEDSIPGHPAVVSIIKEMRGAAKAYLEAIKLSVKVAGHGITFVANAVSLCERFSWHSGTDIQLFIDEMRKVACLAHDDAKNTFEAFGTVRHTLLQVMHRIPSQIVQIEEKQNPVLSWLIETDVSFLYCTSWGRNQNRKRGMCMV
ncbi:hypothetical protein PILCRDRAFT_6595 [Piloderma croceum F 1598]|uniref:Uncharacterized protein n=1 Tax=Piloderma croceum (strain F 1598) TaxID=765440 RepID=A0A0C3C3Z7_PILCF|nr:hypothetical protein PILCRDRAFT_6595 [Piloderma croceum F 1598]